MAGADTGSREEGTLSPALIASPQVVSAQDLQCVLVGITTPDQAQGQVRLLGHRLEAKRGVAASPLGMP